MNSLPQHGISAKSLERIHEPYKSKESLEFDIRDHFCLTTIVFSLFFATTAISQTVQSWDLKESIGYDWQNELVLFDLEADGELSPEDLALTDKTGRSLPFQLWKEEGLAWLAVLVDLPPYAKRQYSLVKRENARKTPVKLSVRKSDDFVEIFVGRKGVRLGRAKRFEPGTPFSKLPAPILAVRGVSGTWLGEGALKGEHPVSSYSFELEAEGPLFAQAKVRFEFGERKFYQIQIRLIAGEDAVLIEEDFALSGDELAAVSFVKPPDLAPPIGTPSNYSDWLVNKGIGWNDIPTDVERYPRFCFNFTRGLNADRARGVGIGQRKKAYTREDLKHAEKDWRLGFVLTPFQERGYRQNAIGFDSANGKDYLGVFYRFMSRWVHPNENRVLMPWLEEGVVGQFVAYESRREWGIMVTEPGEHTNDILAKRQGRKFGAIRRPHVKHGETPLNKVKDWVLEWDAPGPEAYPRLFFNRDGLKRMKADFKKLSDELKKQIKSNRYVWELLTSDQPNHLAQSAQGHLDGYMKICAHDFLNGGSNTKNTYTHRYQEILRSEGRTLDLILSSTIDAAVRKRLLAWIAFNAYKVSDPDYWAYRGYGGGPSNPNMMSIACNALATCAALLPGHPKQKEWLELCKQLVCADITNSIGPEGAWLESPGYQGAGNSPIYMTVLILRNAGIVDLMKDPVYGKRLISVSRYYANLLTPPDPRFDGKRMPMALGDGMPFHSNYTTFLAHSAAGKFPKEAGNAIWCWQQMGRPMQYAPHILLHERVPSGAIKPVSISGKSQYFPGFGAMLRHGFGTKYETFLTYHHSPFSYGHYDDDLGSFSLFAKGAPLCLDWINYSPNEAEYHNRATYEPDDYPWVVTPLDKFVTHAEADYVRSHETGTYKGVRKSNPVDAAPDWQRQLILVKDTIDPGDATYLVVRDKVFASRPSTTNVWTMAEKGSEKIEGNLARLKGQFGVDVSLFFFKKPPKPLTSKFHHFQPRGMKIPQDQTRIQASSEKGGDFGYVLYPLRRGLDKEPAVRELKNGVVEIRWNDQKRHLIFLFPSSTKVEEAGIQFEGRAGVLKLEKGGKILIPLEAERFE